MKVRRTFLYWGAFFVAMGAVMLAADLNGIDDTSIRDALRFWPLVLVALGIGLLLRGTRLGWAGGMLAAATPGLVLGGAIVAGPRLVMICDDGRSVPLVSRQGDFSGPASVDVTLRCGTLDVGTGAGTGWQLDAGAPEGRAATVESSPNHLSVTSGPGGWSGLSHGRDAWHLTLPAAVVVDAAFTVDAGAGRLDLAGAQLGRVSITANAADLHADLAGATVGHLSAGLNAGELALTLPAASDVEGSLSVNAGALKICAPAGLGLRIRSNVTLGSARYPGLAPSGDTWESPDYATAGHHAQLTVEANLGSIELNPIGGCK